MKMFLVPLMMLLSHSALAAESTDCSRLVQITVQNAMNAASHIDIKDPIYVAGVPRVLSDVSGVRVWSVEFDLGADGGGKFEAGVVTVQKHGSACVPVSAFYTTDEQRLKRLPLR